MFMAAIVASFWYLRMEEIDREKEALHRDVEYAQQRVRLRLLERQEQLMRMARDIGNHDLGESDFASRAEALISQYPELQSITWIDAQRRILASQSAPTVSSEQLRIPREVLRAGDALEAYQLAREMQQPIYVQGLAHKGKPRRCCNCMCRWHRTAATSASCWASTPSTACCAMERPPKSWPATP